MDEYATKAEVRSRVPWSFFVGAVVGLAFAIARDIVAIEARLDRLEHPSPAAEQDGR